MTFSATNKLTAMAIVSVFETGKAFGKFSTVAVLDDGAGISYGFSQFTHKSGALAAVLERYLAIGGVVGRSVIESHMPDVRRPAVKAIRDLAADAAFRNALRAAGITDEMKQAQVDVALERFLTPAADECSRLGFTSPLALAVIYDSITHGSWEKIRDRVTMAANSDPTAFEWAWIERYVELRDEWLSSIPRLAKTRYRTRFFLKQIAAQNWELRLPVRAQGVTITAADIDAVAKYLGGQKVRQTSSAVEPSLTDSSPAVNKTSMSSTTLDVPSTEAQPPEQQEKGKRREGEKETYLDQVEAGVDAAAAKYDQVGRVATTVTSRTDAAKSFWTTVLGR